MVADMGVDKVANMEVGMVVDMEVDTILTKFDDFDQISQL